MRRAAVTALLVVAGVALAAVAGCAAGPGPAAAGSPSGTGSATTPAASDTGHPTSAVPPATSAPAGIPSSVPSCVDQVAARLTPDERLGQLLMVGLGAGRDVAGFGATIERNRIGGVLYLGGWQGSSRVAAASAALQRRAPSGIALLVAADQEGGQVQQLEGAGFTGLPSALQQGRMPAGELTALWARTGRELTAAGVNVNLAPVADTVPAGSEAANAPIGRYSRQLGSDPAQVAASVRAAVNGLVSSGVTATVKHFPGLGRVTGNTDVTSRGITDEVATSDDAYLEPFRAGIDAGAGLVMVSSARYPKIDAANQAVFSPVVITRLLRDTIGYRGVVVTDDVGVAAAVSGVPAGQRAERFVAAGGDVVLTADPGTVPAMLDALRSRAGRDAAFAAQVEAAARRVLALKERMGLVRCG